MAGRTQGERDGGAAEPFGWRGGLGCLAAVGLLLALVAGIGWVFLEPMGYWPGSSMTTAWTARSDTDGTPPEDAPDRTWLIGDTVVRGGPDGVRAFRAGSGAERWQYAPPRLTDLCALSPTVDGSVALIARTGRDGGCATVAALDLGNGRELWHTSRVPALRTPSERDVLGLRTDGPGVGVGGALNVAGGLGVVLEEGRGAPALRALELRTGAARWTAAVPKGCVPGVSAAAPKQIVTVLTCRDEMKVAAFDPADGSARWAVPLDARRGVPTGSIVTVVSAEPIVLRIDARDLLVFGPDGTPGPRIEPDGPPHRLDGGDVAVSEGRVFNLTSGGRWGRVVAHDLASGDKLWEEDLGGAAYTLGGLHAEAGRVMALKTSARSGDVLYTFDAATGDEEERVFRDLAAPAREVLPYGDLLIVVHPGGGTLSLSAYEPW
ncbi:PQQ-binding-like beta-propeller repeat protein [Streptomyces litmocidini]|uniref:outer membrane protein assembly factor BamB family protein n=1 Tax=Streptomyces litmocidini TaxID=67318 RepID=UPI0033E274C2